jgi:MFS family permease
MTAIGFSVSDAVLYGLLILQIPGTVLTLTAAAFVERLGRRKIILAGISLAIVGELIILAIGMCGQCCERPVNPVVLPESVSSACMLAGLFLMTCGMSIGKRSPTRVGNACVLNRSLHTRRHSRQRVVHAQFARDDSDYGMDNRVSVVQ